MLSSTMMFCICFILILRVLLLLLLLRKMLASMLKDLTAWVLGKLMG